MNYIKEIASGDFFALKALYKEYHTKVYRIALCILRDPFLAKEVAQETFLRVERNVSCYSPVISEAAFILAIARSLSLSIRKKRATEIPEYAQPTAKNGDSVFGCFDEFINLLSPLPEMEREILYLRFIGELNDKEIAMILNKNPRVIKRLYQKALYKLDIEWGRKEEAVILP